MPYLKAMIIPIVTGALGIIPEHMKDYVSRLTIEPSLAEMQAIALMATSYTLGKVSSMRQVMALYYWIVHAHSNIFTKPKITFYNDFFIF